MVDISSGTSAIATGTVEAGTAGGTLNATKVNAAYWDTATSNWKLAQATGVANAGRDGVGICLNSAVTGERINVARKGRVTMAGLTKGTIYAVSAAAAGGIAPVADLVSTNYVTILGVAESTTVLILDPIVSGTTI